MSKYDASNEEDVAAAEEEARLLQTLRDEVVAEIMDTQKGRDWMHGLLTFTGLFETSFDKNALQMAKNEGERNIGLRLLADIHRVCPEQYVVMIQEKADDR